MLEDAGRRGRADRPLPAVRPRRHLLGGEHLGSRAILQAIEASEPSLAVCGHIHESWGAESRMGPTRIVNLGPDGALLDVGD